MTTKRRLQSESESGDGASPTNGAKHLKTNGSSPNLENEQEEQVSLKYNFFIRHSQSGKISKSGCP